MLWLLIAYAFAATRNLGTLTRQLGLTTRPTLGGGAFAWVALAMGAASLYFTPGEPALSEQTATHSREGTAAWSRFRHLKRGPEDRDVATALNNLSAVLEQAGNLPGLKAAARRGFSAQTD